MEYNQFEEYECRCYLNKIRKKSKTKTAYSIMIVKRGLSASFYKGKVECENGYYSEMMRLWMKCPFLSVLVTEPRALSHVKQTTMVLHPQTFLNIHFETGSS